MCWPSGAATVSKSSQLARARHHEAVGRFILHFQEQKLSATSNSPRRGRAWNRRCDRLAESGWPVTRINNGSTALDSEHYANRGAEIWFEGRTQIEKHQIILPNDKELISATDFPTWLAEQQGQIGTGKQTGHALTRTCLHPDRADAVLGAIAKLSTGSGWTAEAVKQFKASNPEIHFQASTQPEFDRDAAKQPFRITPGQNPGTPNLSRMGVWTPTRTFTPRR